MAMPGEAGRGDEGLVRGSGKPATGEPSRSGRPSVAAGAVPGEVIAGGAAPVLASAGAVAPAAEVSMETEDEDEEFITSPIVGTFYSAAAPDIPAFVRVGDHVKSGQTVCILEAMKLMNEIQAEYDCEIEAVLVSNEQKVEYGQPLFRVKKL